MGKGNIRGSNRSSNRRDKKPDRVDMAVFNALDSKRSRGAESPTPTEEAERIANGGRK